MSGSEDDGYEPWANPAEPFQASGNCGSIDSIWGKQEVFPSALRMHKPVNAELDQVLSVNVGNTVYFQVQASLFSAVAIVCLLSIKCVFSSRLISRDSTCRLVHIRVVWLILSLLVLKYIVERRCGVICPKLVQLKKRFKTKVIFHLEISAGSTWGDVTFSLNRFYLCRNYPAISGLPAQKYPFSPGSDTKISREALHTFVNGEYLLLTKPNVWTGVTAFAHKPACLSTFPLLPSGAATGHKPRFTGGVPLNGW